MVAPHAAGLCDWLASVYLSDGGLPFALPIGEPAGCARFWLEADSTVSSLHIAAAVTALAHLVARHDPAVARHPWLAQATNYCLEQTAARDKPGSALELRYVLQFLDAVCETHPEAAAHLDRLGPAIPSTGSMHVEGGLDDEMMRPLDFAPIPDRPVRQLFSEDVISADLRRLETLQASDGGWPGEWASYSAPASLEWRGWLTVRALSILHANSRAGG